MAIASIDDAALRELRSQVQAAEHETSAALFALSSRAFICPALHDSVRSSASYRHWQACGERARQLKRQLDTLARVQP